MLNLILAGGYGRRLVPLTDYYAKPLLPLGDKRILDWILEKLPSQPTYISTNQRFYEDFLSWKGRRDLEIVVEKTLREEEKPGAVGGILYFLKETGVREGILVINGDNVFDFDLKRMEDTEEPVNLVYRVEDLERIRGRLGNVVMEGKWIKKLVEKPPEPLTPYVSTGIYYFPPSLFPRIEEFLKGRRKDRDNLGSFLCWLMEDKGIRLRGEVREGKWVDIGSRKTYLEAYRIFLGKDVYVSGKSQVRDSQLISTVVLGEAEILKCHLEGCIVDEDTHLEGVSLKETIVGRGSYLVVR